MSTLKSRFAELRAERPEISQADLARATGAKPPSVNAWFTGQTKSMKVDTAVAAAALYGVSPHWLATGHGPKHMNRDSVQVSTNPLDFDLPTEEAMRLARLYDLIPEKNLIQRAQAYNAATSAIVAVLEGHKPVAIASAAQGQKKQPV